MNFGNEEDAQNLQSPLKDEDDETQEDNEEDNGN